MAEQTAIDGAETLPGREQLKNEEEHTLESSFEISGEPNLTNGKPPVFTQVDPRTLKPHQKNEAIYGSEEDVTELIELIRTSGWVKPLVVTPTGTIISGHQRCKAVLALGWESILVEVREYASELKELEALLLENASRLKTTEQKVREANAWKEVESAKASIRQILLAGTRPNTHAHLQANLPEGEHGQTRDAIARRVGLRARNYEKAAKVVETIDEQISNGNSSHAQALRRILNEQSVNAAYQLTKKSPQERDAILSKIIGGEAKSIKQAVKMVDLEHYADFNNPEQATLCGFSVGDWVLVNDSAQKLAHIGNKGQVEQIFPVEQQISVRLGDSPDKERFYPHELTLIIKAPPPNPFRIGEIAFIDIDATEAASDQEKRWNGYWGKVTHLGEVGSISVDVGSQSLQLFPRDLKQIDSQGTEFRQLVERVLRLRRLDLDEVEEGILDVLQRREWFTSRQLAHLDFIEKFYIKADSQGTENHQVV